MVARVAIHVHVYYQNLAQQLFDCVANIISVVGQENVRTYVTYPSTDLQIQEMVSDKMPNAIAIPVPNKGYDIGPFFEVLKLIDFSWADYIVKIHTKRDVDGWVNFRPFKGAAWRDALLGFCSTPKAFQRVLRSFCREPGLGMIADRRLIDPSGVGMGWRFAHSAELLLRDMGLVPRNKIIVNGTMFVARARLLRVFSAFSINQFDDVTSRNEHVITGLAAMCEGAIPMAIEAQGFRVAQGVFPRILSRLYYKGIKYIFMALRYMSDSVRKSPKGRFVFDSFVSFFEQKNS